MKTNHKVIADIDTNFVYISALLKNKYKSTYDNLTRILDETGIGWGEVQNTRDIWVRDFMPLQYLGSDGLTSFLIYRYHPDYLQTRHYKSTESDAVEVAAALGIYKSNTSTIIDGGNVVRCGDYIVMTDKVFKENGYEKNDPVFLQDLEEILGQHIIIIPWHSINPNSRNGDVFGHSDGFIHWCGGKNVLMSNHRTTDNAEAAEIKRRIEAKGFNVTEMLFDVRHPNKKYDWAYINYLQVGKHIFMPVFNIEEDGQAFCYIKDANPDCSVHCVPLAEIADDGGALHCITWNIRLNK